MAYSKNTWQSGDVVTSAKLNNIENGIANCNGAITLTEDEGAGTVTLSVSYNDVLRMINTGIFPFAIKQSDADGNTIMMLNVFYESGGVYVATFDGYDFIASSADELLTLGGEG